MVLVELLLEYIELFVQSLIILIKEAFNESAVIIINKPNIINVHKNCLYILTINSARINIHLNANLVKNLMKKNLYFKKYPGRHM